MGQYYYPINITKKQYINPHLFGDGLKLLEFGCSQLGTMTALACLLADGNGRGGGDLYSDNSIIGSWAGDKIVIAGDYADKGRFIQTKDLEGLTDDKGNPLTRKNTNLHSLACETFKDISYDVWAAMLDDGDIRKMTEENLKNFFAEGCQDTLKDLILIAETSKETLPLLIGQVKTAHGIRILEKRLKC